MVTVGIDAHKRTHTAVACDEQGRELASLTIGTSSHDHVQLVAWASELGHERRFAVEDCRHVSRRLERDLLCAGEQIVRVPPKLMANARSGARTYGKSDAIDALSVARAALREPRLPCARLDGPERELRLLSDHREDLVHERTRMLNRLRWHLHELDPDAEPTSQSLIRVCTLTAYRQRSRASRGSSRNSPASSSSAVSHSRCASRSSSERSWHVSSRSRPPCSRSSAAAP